MLLRTLVARAVLAIFLALAPFASVRLWQMTPASLQLRVTPYIRPEFAREIESLRPVILDAAKRHNRPQLSGMSDREFAAVIALLLYNEHFGWLEDALPPVRMITPAYQQVQVQLNQNAGSDLTVWPANIRPSVALEIVRQELPLPAPHAPITVPVQLSGSTIDITAYKTQRELYAALNGEISQPALAVEYLAANLERGLYRAQFEGVQVRWQTLAAWHNQGIVAPADIGANPTASDYIRRAAVYRAAAVALVEEREKD